MSMIPVAIISRNALAAAAMDFLLEAEWEFRLFSFDAHWDTGERLGSWRNGEGAALFVVLKEQSFFVKGYAPDSVLVNENQDSLLTALGVEIPATLLQDWREPAFDVEQASFVAWSTSDNEIAISPMLLEPVDAGGLARVWSVYTDGADAYQKMAEPYFETAIPKDLLQAVFRLEPMSEAMHNLLATGRRAWRDVRSELENIGFPLQP